MNNSHSPLKKPKTLEEQVDVLWDVVCNHVMSKLRWQDIKLNFVLIFLAILIGLVSLSLTVMITQ